MYHITCNAPFTVTCTTEVSGDITTLHLHAVSTAEPGKLELKVEWEQPSLGAHLLWSPWSPMKFLHKYVPPTWDSAGAVSNATNSAPVLSCLGFDDANRVTLACSDAKNRVRLDCSVVEATAMLRLSAAILVECTISEYRADLRIDRRNLPFYEIVKEITQWWEGFDGYAPAAVPPAARDPLFSTWYSYHQDLTPEALLEECHYYSRMGCKAIILDDGWHTVIPDAGYSSCGDWEPTPDKFPDMKAFVDAVHQAGMKLLLWYSVPFVGELTKAYERFRDKMLRFSGLSRTWIVDPRYPDVRDYLIDIYRRAMVEWGLDGFKLDFIDCFAQSDEVKPGMDYVSVYDAVDRLMKDVLAELRRIKPDVLLEFRQGYIGPLMRTFGNMLRASDSPGSSWINRLKVLTLRMTSGNTAVHSDMTMWNPAESPEEAAYQLTGVLFSVPQISVRSNCLTSDQAQMVQTYLDFWLRYREVLLDGSMFYRDYALDFPYVSARLGNIQVGAVYGGRVAELPEPTDEIALVNGSGNSEILLSAAFDGVYQCRVTDCLGRETFCGQVDLGAPVRLPMPVNGYAVLTKV